MSNDRERPFDRITADCIAAKTPLPEKLATQFERIATHLNSIWGTSAAGDYLDELIFSKRLDRRGFPPDVANEIVALKRLHQQKYVAAKDSAWDSYDRLYEAKTSKKGFYTSKSSENVYKSKSGTSVPEPDSPNPAKPAALSLARTGDAIQPVAEFNRTRSRPERQSSLAILRLFPGSGPEPATMQSPRRSGTARTAATDRDELLEDAEMLLAEGRRHSSIGLFERLIALHPSFSAYPYLRLLEAYFELGRRTEFEPVAIKLTKTFNCKPVRWIEFERDFWTQLDEVADELAQTRRHLSPVKQAQGHS